MSDGDGSEAGHCEYCGTDYTDPNGIASDGYMWVGHLLYDCPDVPEEVYGEVNGPPESRDQNSEV